jgi:hypothetical protein
MIKVLGLFKGILAIELRTIKFFQFMVLMGAKNFATLK